MTDHDIKRGVSHFDFFLQYVPVSVIQITLMSRLEKFNLESLASITQNDEMELWSLGEKKTAIFAVIPDNDSSFNFLVGMLYTQMFQQLYYQADIIHGGRLPVHVHFCMDEFANVALPDEFDKLLSTMRSREISVSIINRILENIRRKDPFPEVTRNSVRRYRAYHPPKTKARGIAKLYYYYCYELHIIVLFFPSTQ